MKKTRLLAALLCLLMILATACGSETTPATDSATPAAPAADSGADAAPATSGDVVTITFMGWEQSPLETAAVEAGIARFEELNPHIKVDYTSSASGGDYTAKLLSTAAGGTMPDTMFMQTSDYRTFVANNTLTDITDRFSAEFPLDDFIDSSRTIMDVDGRVYGISSCTVSPILYYNKDVFDEMGIPYPDPDPANAMTMDEFRDLAKQLTTDDIYGVYGLEVVRDTLTPFLASNNESMYSADYTRSTMNTPGVAEIFELFYDIRHVDGSSPDAVTLEGSGMSSNQMLQTGRVAMLIDGSWALQELSTMSFPVGMAPLPKFQRAVTTGQAHLHCIASSSPNQEAAWEFLSFLSGYDYQGSLVSAGLWMPNRKSMYTDEGVAEWYDETVHTEAYAYMLDYFKDAEVNPAAMQLSSKCTDIVEEESQKFFREGQDIETTLANMESRMNQEIERMAG